MSRLRWWGDELRPIASFALTFVVALASSSSLAWGWADGSGGPGGCCGLPPELEERGRALEESFLATKPEDLARQKWAGTLCQNHPCEGEVTEDQAKDLLLDLQARQQRDADRALSWWGIGLSVLSAIAELWALWLTQQAGKLARESDVRSIRSEARLDQIKGG